MFITEETTGVNDKEFIVNTTNNETTLVDLLNKAQEIQKECADFNVSEVSERNIYFSPTTGKLNFRCDEGQFYNYNMSKYAMSQLCSKLGIPVRYLERCVKDGHIDLAETNVNTWLSEYNKNLFLRTYKNRVRGVLTDRYTVLDTPDILSALVDVINPNDFNIKGQYLSPERFHARITHKNRMNISDDLFAGIQVDSSDVGRSLLTVSFFIYKQVCTNGLIIAKQGGVLFSQKHIGQTVDDFRNDFKIAVSQIPVLAEKYQGFIDTAKDNVLYYEDDIRAFLHHNTDLSEDSVNKVITISTEKYDHTQWGIINAVTEVAHDFTLERRLEIERLAGDMLLRVA